MKTPYEIHIAFFVMFFFLSLIIDGGFNKENMEIIDNKEKTSYNLQYNSLNTGDPFLCSQSSLSPSLITLPPDAFIERLFFLLKSAQR
jgi:hypothetical protein